MFVCISIHYWGMEEWMENEEGGVQTRARISVDPEQAQKCF